MLKEISFRYRTGDSEIITDALEDWVKADTEKFGSVSIRPLK